MRKIVISRGVVAGGIPRRAGEVVEIADGEALALVASGRATEYKITEAADPQPKTRRPKK